MNGDAGTTRTDGLAAGSCISDSPCAPQCKRLKKFCSCPYFRLLGPSISFFREGESVRAKGDHVVCESMDDGKSTVCFEKCEIVYLDCKQRQG